MRKYVIICDVCGGEAKYETVDLHTIFTTEQTEGRSVDKYLSKQKLDLCENCMSKILDGNGLFGRGAMGNNRYWFQENKDEGV